MFVGADRSEASAATPLPNDAAPHAAFALTVRVGGVGGSG
jgi:hypothetical protein